MTNQARSQLAEEASLVLHCRAGQERSIPASKTFTASLLLLAMLATWLHPEQEFAAALERVPAAIATVLGQEAEVGAAGDWLLGGHQAHRLVVLGRGYHLATAQETALKIMETSYIPAQAASVADFLHGPAAVLDPGFPVLLLAARGPALQGMRRLGRWLHPAELGCWSSATTRLRMRRMGEES